MKNYKKVLVLTEDEAKQLWNAVEADNEEHFFNLGSSVSNILPRYDNFQKVAYNMWIGKDMASPELGETFVFKFCCNSGTYILELESLKRGN